MRDILNSCNKNNVERHNTYELFIGLYKSMNTWKGLVTLASQTLFEN